MNYIEYKEGKVYDPTHLRPFDLELAKLGHPLAWRSGEEVSHLLAYDLHGGIRMRIWSDKYKKWEITDTCEYEDGERLRLAPLTIKNGKSLHVGDVIEIDMIHHFGKWVNHVVSFSEYENGIYLPESKMWRWPQDKQ